MSLLSYNRFLSHQFSKFTTAVLVNELPVRWDDSKNSYFTNSDSKLVKLKFDSKYLSLYFLNDLSLEIIDSDNLTEVSLEILNSFLSINLNFLFFQHRIPLELLIPDYTKYLESILPDDYTVTFHSSKGEYPLYIQVDFKCNSQKIFFKDKESSIELLIDSFNKEFLIDKEHQVNDVLIEVAEQIIIYNSI